MYEGGGDEICLKLLDPHPGLVNQNKNKLLGDARARRPIVYANKRLSQFNKLKIGETRDSVGLKIF